MNITEKQLKESGYFEHFDINKRGLKLLFGLQISF